jgi:hypothetical protein
LLPGTTKVIHVKGKGGVPLTGVSAVVLNVTVTNTNAASFLVVWPSDAKTMPLASNLNWTPGQTVANRVIVPIDQMTGTVSIFSSASNADLIVDVGGWFTDTTDPTGLLFTSTSPTRVCDTRAGSGVQCQGMTLGPGGKLNVALAAFVPATAAPATAVVLNLTGVAPSAPTYVQIYPGPSTSSPPNPPTSDLNIWPGWVRANMVVVKLGTDISTSINAFNLAGNTNIVMDVAGWYS